MNRKDLLKEAIADAKQVKETAIANAKLALQDAFTPTIETLVSEALNEADDVNEDETVDETNVDETKVNEDETVDETVDENETVDEKLDSSGIGTKGKAKHMEGVDEAEETNEAETTNEMEDEEDEDELDLDEVIAELENSDVNEEDSVDEKLDSSGIGTKGKAKHMENVNEEEDMDDDEEDEDMDETVDLEEVIKAIREMDGDDEKDDEDEKMDEVETLKTELAEAHDVIESLKSTINEVNLLNAKLLYTTKLFRTFELSEGQKEKILEGFDRTSSVREVKIVFATLAESLNGSNVSKKKFVKEGLASKATTSSAPKEDKVITEGNELANRFKKLAGILK